MLGEAVEDVEHTDPGLAGLAQELVGADPTQRPGEEEIPEEIDDGPGAGGPRGAPRPVRRTCKRPSARKAYEDATGRSNASVHQPEVLVVGPSGVGKTALVDEFVESSKVRANARSAFPGLRVWRPSRILPSSRYSKGLPDISRNKGAAHCSVKRI